LKSLFEFVAKHVEPSVKRALVKKLLDRGVDRSTISRCIGVSQSLITRYIRGERGLHDFTAIREVDEILERLASRVASGELCGLPAYVEVVRVVMYILSKKYVCGIHYVVERAVDPAKCNICSRLFKGVVPIQ
jgi:predicted transcriptional regulator